MDNEALASINMNKRKTTNILVSLLLLVLAITFIGPKQIAASISRISIEKWVLSSLIAQFAFVCSAFRWSRLINGEPRDHLGYYFKSLFFNFFTPSALGSDGYRLAYLRSKKYKYKTVILALLKERFIGLYGSMFLLLVATISVHSLIEEAGALKSINITVITTCIIFLAIGILARLSRSFIDPKTTFRQLEYSRSSILSKIVRQIEYLPEVAGLEKDLILQVLTLCGQLLWTCSVYIIATGLEVNLSFQAILYAVLLTELSRLIPISAQGLGVREIVFAYTLTGLGYNTADMYAASAISYIMLAIMQCLNWPFGTMLNSYLNYRE